MGGHLNRMYAEERYGRQLMSWFTLLEVSGTIPWSLARLISPGETLVAPPENTLVNLFIIGGMKCGTTSLFSYLAASPAIGACSEKEPMFFSHAGLWEKGVDWYESLFDWSQSTQWFCQASTSYTRQPFRPDAAARLYQYNPDARLIFIAREPFARIVSHYKHMVRIGVEERGFLEALLSDDDYLVTSLYAYQLHHYTRWFPTSQLLILSFDELVRYPDRTLGRIADWLESDLQLDSSLTGTIHQNASSGVTRIINLNVDARLKRFARASGLRRLLRRTPIWRLLLRARKPFTQSSRIANFNDPGFLVEVEQGRDALGPILNDADADFEKAFEFDTGEWQNNRTSSDHSELTRRFQAKIEAMCAPGYSASYSCMRPRG
ncbi:MAG: sulfotransferase [Proteobacteria bacterium]|nr:sulfotransferase [Pseudomonadota bacterium]